MLVVVNYCAVKLKTEPRRKDAKGTVIKDVGMDKVAKLLVKNGSQRY